MRVEGKEMAMIRNLVGLMVMALVAGSAWAEETQGRLMLNEKGMAVVAAPSFKEPLDATWRVAKGKWTPAEGELKVEELAAEKHAAVLHHLVGLKAAVIDLEFRLDGAGTFYVGCDSAKKHVGRVVVKADGAVIAEDSVKPSHTIATLKTPVKVGEWHRLHVEWKGDKMAARLDGKELQGQHEYLGTAKVRSWLAVGKTVTVRNLTIVGEK